MRNEGRRLFGTDGVRGIANVEPMTSETALRLGRALAHVSRRSNTRHKILIGKDTRLSGYMLETAMASGICSMGVDVLLVGPLPTPGIAFLTRSLRADAGVVISASHNPFQDNGIKFFSPAGFKLPDEQEAEIERLVLSNSIDTLRPTASEIGKAFRIDDAGGRYNVFLKSTFPRHLTLDGLSVVIDCGHGAGYKVGPEVLEELGAQTWAIGVDPDGHNINRECGALHPEELQDAVCRRGAHVGVALDGDADRAIFVDEKGAVVDGDEIMAILAAELHERGELRRETLVATVMSNLGLHEAMGTRGIRVVTTPVGDRHVVEEMVRAGYNLGGEQSGHIVFLDHNTTGDGLVTCLTLLALMTERGRSLSELRRVMRRFPQVQRSVRVDAKPDVGSVPSLTQAIQAAERALGTSGRVLVRYSGTEAVLRVMVEGEDEQHIAALADGIVAAAEAAIGVGARAIARA
jgi:phosphoglucosamine mutase